MSDNLQKTQLPQGVNTPAIENVVSISYANGYTVQTTSAPVNLTIGAMNVGNLTFALADGLNFSGRYNFKVTLGTTISFVGLDVKAQAYVGSPNKKFTIEVTGVADSDQDILKFKNAIIMKSNVDNTMCLLVNFVTNAPSATTASVVCDSMGNPAPINITLANPAYNVLVSTKYVDIRNAFDVKSKLVDGENVSLNSIYTPGLVSVNPTDAPSRPSGSNGNGVCATFGSSDSKILSQIFTDKDNGQMYTRVLGVDGVTWGAWVKIIRETDISQIIASTSQTQILDAIVFG